MAKENMPKYRVAIFTCFLAYEKHIVNTQEGTFRLRETVSFIDTFDHFRSFIACSNSLQVLRFAVMLQWFRQSANHRVP